jgi:hypothetical protein
MSLKSCQELVEKLLSENNSKYTNTREKIIYERGYLTGLLAKLAYEDSYVRQAIRQRLKDNE